VARFLKGEIGFLDIPRLVERTMALVQPEKAVTLETVLEADASARRAASEEPARYLR